MKLAWNQGRGKRLLLLLSATVSREREGGKKYKPQLDKDVFTTADVFT